MESRTPLRRISRGSLSALSRSATYSHSHPSTLGIPDMAFENLADEIEQLSVNIEGLKELDQTLRDFNEGFSSYLWSMRMNAFLTEWHQVPSDNSFKLAAERKAAAEKLNPHARKPSESKTTQFESHSNVSERESTSVNYTATNLDPESTLVEQPSSVSAKPSGTGKKVTVKKKKGGKPVLSAKEKRERGMIIENAINALPLEFRGDDPNLRRNAESVIEGLMDAGQNGVKITDLIRPDCNQARVNKCLIALVNRKIVSKTANAGVVIYSWVGLPS